MLQASNQYCYKMEGVTQTKSTSLLLLTIISFSIIQIYFYTNRYSLNTLSADCFSHHNTSYFDRIKRIENIVTDSRFQNIFKRILNSTSIQQLGLDFQDRKFIKKVIDVLHHNSQRISIGNLFQINMGVQNQENNTFEVCPETNAEQGFGTSNCSNIKPFPDIMTVVLNLVHYPLTNESIFRILIQNLVAKYPNITVHVAVQQGMFSDKNNTIPAKLHFFSKVTKDAAIWNKVIRQVKTPYTFVARDVLKFDEDCRLERLVRAISKLNISVAGGSMKNKKGYWNMACHQSVFRNYTLIYQSGYHHSEYDCLWCAHITGPFVARTNLLRKIRFDENLERTVIFEDLFFRLHQSSHQMIVCPDSMFNVQADYNTTYNKSDLLPFAKKWEINQLQLSHNGLFTFTCKQLGIKCSKHTGKVLSPCCVQILADQIKLVMDNCVTHNIICQLNAGTALGAIKFGGVLPWELDADIHYLHSNMTAMKNLKKIFVAKGNRFVYEYTHGHNFFLYNSGWKVEVWHFDRMDSQIAIENGRLPTKVLFDGMWCNTFRNPALKMRVLYSPEIFKHVQHKFAVGKKVPGTFSKCPSPGKQYCLDQYKIDGNFQFRLPSP